MNVMIVVINDEDTGQIGSMIPYTDEEAAVADYLAARQSEGDRAQIYVQLEPGGPAVRMHRVESGSAEALEPLVKVAVPEWIRGKGVR